MEVEPARTPMYNSTSGEQYKPNGHLPVVAVIGLDVAESPCVRAIRSYGFEAVHCDPDSKLPLHADAAICITTALSHNKFYEAKNEFKKQEKKVFFTPGGFSEIKPEFELFFFGELKKSLATLNWTQRFTFFIAYLVRTPGSRFKYSDLFYKMLRYYPEASKCQLNNTIVTLRHEGVVDHYQDRRGHYVFLGLTEKLFKKLKEAGADPRIEWLKPKVVEVPKVEEIVLKVAPVVMAEAISEPIPKPDENLGTDLLLMAATETDRKLDAVLARLSALESIIGELRKDNKQAMKDELIKLIQKF